MRGRGKNGLTQREEETETEKPEQRAIESQGRVGSERKFPCASIVQSAGISDLRRAVLDLAQLIRETLHQHATQTHGLSRTHINFTHSFFIRLFTIPFVLY